MYRYRCFETVDGIGAGTALKSVRDAVRLNLWLAHATNSLGDEARHTQTGACRIAARRRLLTREGLKCSDSNAQTWRSTTRAVIPAIRCGIHGIFKRPNPGSIS